MSKDELINIITSTSAEKAAKAIGNKNLVKRLRKSVGIRHRVEVVGVKDLTPEDIAHAVKIANKSQNGEFWLQRLEDLSKLTSKQFAEKYNVNAGTADNARRRFLGRRYGNSGDKIANLSLLKKDTSNAKNLGISVGYARKLRWIKRKRLKDGLKDAT